MKFSRARLVAVVEQEIADREAEHAKVLAEVTEQYETAKQEWLDGPKPDLIKEAAQKISRKVGRGGLITSEDVAVFDHRNQSDTTIFNRTKPEDDYRVKRNGKPKTEQLESLLKVLAVIDDDVVTTTALRDIGFRDIDSLLRRAL